ncbi:hypothetical protein pb186bvf_018052 [Paramecium bursaria]
MQNFNGLNSINNNFNPINSINPINNNKQTIIPNQNQNRSLFGVGQPQQDNKRLSFSPEGQNMQVQSQLRFATYINPPPKQASQGQIFTPPPNFQAKQNIPQQPSTPIIQSNKQIIPTTPIKQDVSQQQLLNKIQSLGIYCSDQSNITDEERISLENILFKTVQEALQRQEDRKVKFN